jgi:hypothetical protein
MVTCGQYFHGRTETIRSTSSSSLAFVKAMSDPGSTREAREALFRCGFAPILALYPPWLHTHPGFTPILASHPSWLHTHPGFTPILASHPSWLHTHPGFTSILANPDAPSPTPTPTHPELPSPTRTHSHPHARSIETHEPVARSQSYQPSYHVAHSLPVPTATHLVWLYRTLSPCCSFPPCTPLHPPAPPTSNIFCSKKTELP